MVNVEVVDIEKMRKMSNKEIKVTRAIKYQNECIVEAAGRGKNQTVWALDTREWEDVETFVKNQYIDKGYTFRPIGIIGGVRQDGLYICW